MSRLAQLKNTNTAFLNEQLNALEKSTKKFEREDDKRYWKLATDKEGNGSATIRFLPAPEGESLPYVKYMSYSFKNKDTGKWYIERSLASLDKKDPVGELWQKYNNSNSKELVDLSKTFNRRTNYVANILVVRDPANPENNNSVRLFRFGQKIMDKIISKTSPEDKDDPRIDVFHMLVGCNFRLRQRQVAGFPNYDNSEWDSISPISKDDEALEKIDSSLHSLEAEVSEDKFKDYNTLKLRLATVLGTDEEIKPRASTKASEAISEEVDPDADFLNNLGATDDEELPF